MSEFAAQTAQQKSLATMAGGGILQRKCACGQHKPAGGECAECKKKRRSLQRYPVSRAEPIRVPSVVHEVLRSPGQPLDVGTRESMEQRFAQDFCRVRTHTTRPQMAASGLKVGPANDRFEQEADYLAEKVIRSAPFGTSAQATGVTKPDFSQVRVHTGAKAAESAHSVNALAYTVGRDVVFGAGQYAPQASEGKRLLAHELTHVLQQASRKDPGSSRSLQRRRGSRGAATTPGQRLEFHPAMHPSLLGGPCACLVVVGAGHAGVEAAMAWYLFTIMNAMHVVRRKICTATAVITWQLLGQAGAEMYRYAGGTVRKIPMNYSRRIFNKNVPAMKLVVWAMKAVTTICERCRFNSS